VKLLAFNQVQAISDMSSKAEVMLTSLRTIVLKVCQCLDLPFG